MRDMENEELRERAKAWLEANTQIQWVTESEEGIPPSELNRRPDKYAGWLADFAAKEIERSAAEVERLKVEIERKDEVIVELLPDDTECSVCGHTKDCHWSKDGGTEIVGECWHCGECEYFYPRELAAAEDEQ